VVGFIKGMGAFGIFTVVWLSVTLLGGMVGFIIWIVLKNQNDIKERKLRYHRHDF
jgi:hypothetical protein